MSASRSALSSSLARETLASAICISQRLQDALVCQPMPLQLLHRSQWRCLARSYSAVTKACVVLLEDACSILEPLEQESMCCKLTGPLDALHRALQEGETCMQESLPSSSPSTHSWLLEKALKLGMSTEVVDLHLQRLLWTSSVVREQILRYAPIHDIELVLSEHTRHLCDIWSHVDAEDDLLLARSLLNRIINEESAEERGDTRQLAHFILQKLSCPELSSGRIAESNDLPPFLWVDPEDLKKEAEIIGQGSFGCVQEAVWLGGRFAVKDFPNLEDNVVFGREAAIQAQLHHPNVISLVCCSKSPLLQKCSLVMELMHQNLRAFLIQRKKASGTESSFPDLLLAIDLMSQIAQGMEYLHSESLRVIHRDIRSTNILVSLKSRLVDVNDVTPHVHLKVADFGMSKSKYASSRYTTMQVGSTAWRAPEVFEVSYGDKLSEEEGHPHPNVKYTNKADVYSFGMVCYEIFTGKSPFEDTRRGSILGKVLSGERPKLPGHCPPALSSYIERCWHADPEQRPTFTQICRMLRYFKACISLQDHDHDQNAAECRNWLLHPLSTSMCARIDDMLQGFIVVPGFGGTFQPQLLVIPLEMYCCRVVLQTEAADEFNSLGRGEGIHEEAKASMKRLPVKSYFNRISKWLKKLSRTQHSRSSDAHHKGILSKSGETRHVGTLSPSGDTRHEGILSRSGDIQREETQKALGLMGDFTYEQLCVATNNFSKSAYVGASTSGAVYRGQLPDGRSIAVKVCYRSHQILDETSQELRIANQLRHRSIVPLLGWCLRERDNLLLVYEYMPNGDLGKHIFPEDETVFKWQQRYKAVRQVAEAIKYLHQDSDYRQIVHRDVKTSNIMLDSEWNARLGDCGAAVLLDEEHSPSDIPLLGTVGYMPPECLNRKLSPASDVYSFGVTVLEIATGRRALFRNSENNYLHIPDWVWELYQNGEVLQAADVRLALHFDEAEMRRLLVLGLACTNADPQARPTMEDVLRILSTASDPPPPQDRPLIRRG